MHKRQDYCTSTMYTTPPGPTKTVYEATERTRETVDCGGCKFLCTSPYPALADQPTAFEATATMEGTTTERDYKCFTTYGGGYSRPVQGAEIMNVGATLEGRAFGGRGGKIEVRTETEEGTPGVIVTEEPTMGTMVVEEEDGGRVTMTKLPPYPSIPKIPQVPTGPPQDPQVTLHA